MRELTEKEIANLEQCGRVGFGCKDLAAILSVPLDEVEEEFRNEKGKVYEIWLKGRMQVELELRQSMLKEALGGSSPMMEKMLKIYHETEESIQQLTY